LVYFFIYFYNQIKGKWPFSGHKIYFPQAQVPPVLVPQVDRPQLLSAVHPPLGQEAQLVEVCASVFVWIASPDREIALTTAKPAIAKIAITPTIIIHAFMFITSILTITQRKIFVKRGLVKLVTFPER
jgi:hypothetical protein